MGVDDGNRNVAGVFDQNRDIWPELRAGVAFAFGREGGDAWRRAFEYVVAWTWASEAKSKKEAEDAVDGVADMLEFVVQIVAVVLEPVLKAFKKVGRKEGAVAEGSPWVPMALRRSATRAW